MGSLFSKPSRPPAPIPVEQIALPPPIQEAVVPQIRPRDVNRRRRSGSQGQNRTLLTDILQSNTTGTSLLGQ